MNESIKVHPKAGKKQDLSLLVDVSKLIEAYYVKVPNPLSEKEQVSFGTSGHRGSSFENSFNEPHILAITQAICNYRKSKGIAGPLYLGRDSHALSLPALISAVEVLAANEVVVILANGDDFVPTPVISHAILTYNKKHPSRVSDGIVITPSHNPPEEGGIKYNPPHGGPAEEAVTKLIQAEANTYLKNKLSGVNRIPYESALKAKTTFRYDYITPYVDDLSSIIDMQVIKESRVKLGVDPLGGAGIHFWKPIQERFGIDLTVVNQKIDPTFSFMTVDWDGKIRMDPSSSYAMEGLIRLKDRFDVAFACDTDHDRHGIVTKEGLLPPNHYLSACIDYLFSNRPGWKENSAVGKTIVSSQMIDRVTASHKRRLYEVPVGFKWFVDGLFDGSLAFCGEESAGASFTRFDGSVWSTDKDGIILCLLAAEMTAKTGNNPAIIYQNLTKKFGNPVYDRFEAKATFKQKDRLKKLTDKDIQKDQLAGEKIVKVETQAPGNHASIGGVKVSTKNGWFAARPSGTEEIYKIYVESFLGKEHLNLILKEAKTIVDGAIKE